MRVNRSAVTSPNPTPLPLRSINHRVFHFFYARSRTSKGNIEGEKKITRNLRTGGLKHQHHFRGDWKQQDKVTADSVPLERPFWNMSRQHVGHHEIDVNTLNQLHEQGEAISPILKDAWCLAWCLDVNSLSAVIFHFVYRDHLIAHEWTGAQ